MVMGLWLFLHMSVVCFVGYCLVFCCMLVFGYDFQRYIPRAPVYSLLEELIATYTYFIFINSLIC